MRRRTALTILTVVLVIFGAATAGWTEVNPGLTDPNNIVNLYGASTADDGTVATFKQVTPTGANIAFSIPAGKTLVITSVEGIFSINSPTPNYMVVKVGIAGDANPGFVTLNLYSSYGAGGIFSFAASSIFPVSVTKPFIAKIYDAATMTPINAGSLKVRVKGYLYPPL